jgi:hypothetical protein
VLGTSRLRAEGTPLIDYDCPRLVRDCARRERDPRRVHLAQLVADVSVTPILCMSWLSDAAEERTRIAPGTRFS